VQEHAVYAGMVEAMDEAIGTVLDALDETKQAERTIVIFFSDNGGLSTSEGHPTSNLPYRAGKGWMYEGGIREPLLVRYPGLTAPGSVNGTVVSSVDFFPTLLELCGLTSTVQADGQSFAPALAGETMQRGPIYWHYPHYGNQGGLPSAAVRHGDWKLLRWYETGQEELFRLDVDPSEQYELAARYPEQALKMSALLDQWLLDVGAVHASLNDKAVSETNGPKGVERLAWMAGHWSEIEGDVVSEEAWIGARGGVMMGVNRTADSKQTFASEQLRIYEEDGVIWYEASPSGQATARFQLISANGKRAVFENLEHDFPQRIEYQRDGDRLTATISGPGEDGEVQSISFGWDLQP
jgi:hypothetical protein